MILSTTMLTIKSRSLLLYQREGSREAIQHYNRIRERGLGPFCCARWASGAKLYPLGIQIFAWVS